MILSRKHEFIFIKARKVAGTSVEIALSTICGRADIITPIGQPDELIRIARGAAAQNYSEDREAERDYVQQLKETPRERVRSVKPPKGNYGNHMTLSQVLMQAGDAARYRVVGLARNPYSKVLSLANMQASSSRVYRRTGVKKAGEEERRRALRDIIESGDLKKLQSAKQYAGRDGRIAVDVLLRYERLAGDFDAFVRSLGIANPPELPHAKQGILADTLDPRRELTADQIKIINETLESEFSTFGYEMIQPRRDG